MAIINCCEHEFTIATETTAGANPLNPIAQYYSIKEAQERADYILVIVHGGHEHFQLPSPRMKETYQFFVDAGADAVVNHHQHCFSGFEIYKGKPIIYGLGNFCFDDPKKLDTIWNYGYTVNFDFSKSGVIFRIVPYKQSSEKIGVVPLNEAQCITFNKKLADLNKIIGDNIALSSEVESYYLANSDRATFVLEPYRNRILDKLFDLGLLPSTVSKARLLNILNLISCESHRDKFCKALEKKVSVI